MTAGIDKILMRRSLDHDIVTPGEFGCIFHAGQAAAATLITGADNPYFTLNITTAAEHMRMAAWEMGWWAGVLSAEKTDRHRRALPE